MSTAYGNVTWWGFSPALHLLQELSKHEVEYKTKNEINVLLVGVGDGRHILKTMSKLKGCSQKVNFYVTENNLEAIARQILFITLLFEPSSEMSIQEKSELFLELFGNSLIRTQTDVYLRKRCNDFIELVTNSSDMPYPIWNLSNLKFKERDELESIFKFWRNEDNAVFNIINYWEERLRQYLGVRYDSRQGAYDWEYSMKLIPNAKIIHWAEYKHWREYGVAFRKREDNSYEIPNKTLASGLVFNKDGVRYPKRGYWGDIVNSPYIAYGIECHDKSLLETRNGAHTRTSTDISFFNVTAMIHELHTGCEYKHIENEDDNGVIIEEVDEGVEPNFSAEKIKVPNVMIHLLPLNCIQGLHNKSKYKSKFDLIFFSNSMIHNLDDSLKPLFSKDGLLIVESTIFMLDLKDELHAEYKKKISGMASSAGCKEIKTFDPEKHQFAYFKYEGV